MSVDAGDVFFVHFIRMKTCEGQGLSLFPDVDYVTCPLLAITLALATQSAPHADLISNFPTQATPQAVALGVEPPLLELLNNPDSAPILQATDGSSTAALSIHSHVNRLLDRIARRAGVEEQITSHSFRRGGAQHANDSVQLTDRWIFDRDAWNASTTDKAFNYVFNTRAEDHKVVKVLSGHQPHEHAPLPDLTVFDAQTQERIIAVQQQLFATCCGMASARHNVSKRVLGVLTACVLKHYPLLKQDNPDSPAVKRLEACALEAKSSLADLLAWSSHLTMTNTNSATQAGEQTQEQGSVETKTEERKIIRHQATVIDHPIGLAKRQDQCLDALEARADTGDARQRERTTENHGDDKQAKRRKRLVATTLRATWIDWRCREPRLWSTDGDKQRKSDAKHITAYMKLFLSSFALQEGDCAWGGGGAKHRRFS